MDFELDFNEIEVEVTETKPKIKPISVSALLQMIYANFRDRFWGVYLVAEISSFKTSGRHAYLTLKDTENDAVISATLWNYKTSIKDFASRTGSREEDFCDGATVEVYGEMTVYEARGSMQLNINRMRIAGGVGEQLAKIQRIKEYILAQGWQRSENKKPIPPFPKTVGIISSSAAAGVKDMLKVFADEGADIKIIIYECNVQGVNAVPTIVNALQTANSEQRCDLLIIGRGGGAFEDLLPFSELEVVEAVVRSQIPIISAVGHEVDNPLTDLVADFSCVTPTAAAKYVCAARVQLRTILATSYRAIENAKNNYFANLQRIVQNFDQRVSYLDPCKKISLYQQQFAQALAELDFKFVNSLQHRRAALGQVQQRLVYNLQQRFIGINNYLSSIRQEVEKYNPQRIVFSYSQTLANLTNLLSSAFNRKIFTYKNQLMQYQAQVNTLGESAILKRSYELNLSESRFNSLDVLKSLNYKQESLQNLEQKLKQHAQAKLLGKQQNLTEQQSKIARLDLGRYLAELEHKVQNLQQQLEFKVSGLYRKKANLLSNLVQKVEMYDPKLPLSRGYAMIVAQDNRPLTSIEQVKENQQIEILMQDGSLEAHVNRINAQSELGQKLTASKNLEKLKTLLEELKR